MISTFRHTEPVASGYLIFNSETLPVNTDLSREATVVDTMAANGMMLRSGRVLGAAPPPPPPAAIPPGQLPPGLPAFNTLMGLPPAVRMTILETVFQGQPRMDLEDLLRPRDLASFCLVNQQLKAEATEAYFRVSLFDVTVLTSVHDVQFLRTSVNWGQPPTPNRPFLYTFQEFRRLVARAQPLSPSRASRSWGRASVLRVSVLVSFI